ncbi:uncharacterized protein LOC128673902 [Plodia interpunctella]|uniref:uncharacterized protein LOC128673902 n=1 Tax=Plodia interpunctella TaxID=58824 RepID=UPI0023676D06|nr:uncharacterized protein LOC128673902 [Plodia interpunctella]
MEIDTNINNDWKNILEGEFSKDYFKDLQKFLDEEYANHEINPKRDQVFEALNLTPFEEVKVVIVGQDPYPGKNQANGLAFSVPLGAQVPPSLDNIYKLLQSDLGYAPVLHGCLKSWATQGVLLLNSILTVRQGETLSHKEKGWETFTDAIIEKLNKRNGTVVFIVWSDVAKKKLITSKNHLILTDSHPTVIYDEIKTDFFGSRPFSRANTWLMNHGKTPIDWKLSYVTNDWQYVLKDEFSKDYFKKDLQEFLDEQYAHHIIYPERRLIFQALELTPFENVKVVIVGQDPGKVEGFGVAFSVPYGAEIPNSTKLQAKQNDLGYTPVSHGCLDSWGRQGVLLLNSILTLRQRKPKSHKDKGWETFTDAIIKKLNEREKPVGFLLWGRIAEKKFKHINSDKHFVLVTSHPIASEYQKNQTDFRGSKPFSKINYWLITKGLQAIDWRLPQGEYDEVDAIGERVESIGM